MYRHVRGLTARLLALLLAFLALPLQAEEVRRFDIPEQQLSHTLLEIARQADVDILVSERLTRGLRSRPVKGAHTAARAVERALAGTGLSYRVTSNGTIIVVRRRVVARKPKSRAATREPVRLQRAPPSPPVVDIVVRAQRRFEFAQDIPLSVSAFGRESLAMTGVNRTIDLQQLEPSLVMSAQSGAIIPFLRGIGNPASSTPGNESSVPVYIDDVYFSRLYPAYLGLDHIDGVEVLKGPQGTLFGRNSTGGLIQIFTRDPGDKLEVETEAGFANFETVTGKAYIAGPLSETLSANLSVSVREQGDGWGRNRTLDKPAYETDFQVLRSKLVWKPDAESEVKLSGFLVRENSSSGTVQGGGIVGYPRGLPPGFEEAHDQPDGFYDIATNFPTERRHRGWGGILRIERALPFADFTSISFYRKSRDPWTSEGDHTPSRWLEYSLPVKDRQFTQELQIKSKAGTDIQWTFGLYFMNAKAAIEPTTVTGEAIEQLGFRSLNLSARQRILSRAVYGQATVPLQDGHTRLTGGIRFTSDRVRGVGNQYAVLADTSELVDVADRLDEVSSFDRLTWKLALDRDLAADVLAFASYSRGFKSGTYNLIPLERPALNPERVDAYEIGIKATLAGGRAQINLSAFHNDISDPQVQIVTNQGGVAANRFDNAERARSRGIELSSNLDLSSGLGMHFSGQVLDAKFLRFENAPYNVPLFEPPFGVVTEMRDAGGNRTPLSPKLKLFFGLSQRLETGGMRITGNANLSYRSSFTWEPDNRIVEPARALINMSLMFEPYGIPGLNIRAWCNNATNQKYFSNVLTQSGPTGFMSSPAEPRTYGIAVRYRL